MSLEITSLRHNAYLTLAREALLRERRPLTPTDMLAVARNHDFLPGHLFGATMHKTLSARLAEHIRRESQRSIFYRTAPASFYLHELASLPDTPDQYKRVYNGHLRTKTIRKENVLVAPREQVKDLIYGEFVPFDENGFREIFKSICRFTDRLKAESDSTVKQFVTFTLVHHDYHILIYRRGKFTTTSDRLKGQLSVGFGGHVNQGDFTLFSSGSGMFVNNAARELREELYLDDLYENIDETRERTRILGYVNVDSSEDAEHHIAVIVGFEHKNATIPKKGELSINQLSWLDLRNKRNDLSDFDLWSEIILRNIYSGVLSFGRN